MVVHIDNSALVRRQVGPRLDGQVALQLLANASRYNVGCPKRLLCASSANVAPLNRLPSLGDQR
jgi:hypothetical protein